MNSPAGLSPTLWLCVAVVSVFLYPAEVVCQTHQWKNRYSSCTKQCGEGIQTLQKYCFTTEQIPKPALESFCSGIPIREKDVISCNTFPCGTCERTYTSPSGTITSPHYPDKFSIPRYCRLFITLPPDNRVLLGFSEFVLEGLNLAAFSDLEESTVCLCGTLVQITDQEQNGLTEDATETREAGAILEGWMTPDSLAMEMLLTEYRQSLLLLQ
ncbi:uncharacterized protein LOC119730118 [Patiria miniata]|uniref:CUB domain-containing protein n=1 Tax=Patiria miniata TaxID=46514 RepID=A0A914A5Z8_PATMI|nr:uncharacterized protein LOC119730118 [Patiria miniata]